MNGKTRKKYLHYTLEIYNNKKERKSPINYSTLIDISTEKNTSL